METGTPASAVARITRVYQWYGAPRVCLEPPVTLAGVDVHDVVSDWDHLARLDVRVGDHVLVRMDDKGQPKLAMALIERRTGNERPIPNNPSRSWMGMMEEAV